MNVIESFLTKNPFYTAGKIITPEGFMLHSIGCSQPDAKVFVKKWNKESYKRACVHAFIDGNTGDVYQTLPWNYRAGHCSEGAKGSGNDTHIGIEMCEPGCIVYKKDRPWEFTVSDADLPLAREIAERTFNSAVELFAYLCAEYKYDPLAPGVILSHKEGGKRGIASGHVDPEHLWKGLGMSYTMDTFRKAVNDKMNESNVKYRVQVGAFGKKENAENYLAKLKAAGFPGYITSFDTSANTEANVNAISMPILSKGSRGDSVKALQSLLNGYGFTDANEKVLVVDGSFGNATLYALKAYQTAKGLEVDGYCGKQTWTSLLI